jgi:hypothetical protein
MAILNYTTKIKASKTAGEIQFLLAQKGASAIAVDYQNGEPEALSFRLPINGNETAFRLPCNWRGVLSVMSADRKIAQSMRTEDQAKRVAWRIVKDWMQAQIAIIESGQALTEEVFLPYAVTGSGQTLFQRIQHDPSRLLSA